MEGPTIYLNSGFFIIFVLLIIFNLIYPKLTEENKKNNLRFKKNKILNIINLVLLNLFVNLILITLPIQRPLRKILEIEVSNNNDSLIFQHMLETYESLSIIFIFTAIEVLIIFILLIIINRRIYKNRVIS